MGNLGEYKEKTYVFIHFKSSYNFLNIKLAEKMGLKLDRGESFNILVANEDNFTNKCLCIMLKVKL